MSALYPLTLALASLCPAAGGGEVVPGRDGRYEFDSSVEGKEWKGVLGVEEPLIIRFESGGVVCHTVLGETWRSMKWWQVGNTIYIGVDKEHPDIRGVVRDDRLVGEWYMARNENWDMHLKRTGP